MKHSTPRRPALGMVLKGYPRISETFISNEILRLEELGFFIRIYSMRKPRENFSHASIKAIKAPVTYLPEYLVKGLPALLKANRRLRRDRPKVYKQGVSLMLSRFRGAPKKHTWFKHFFQAGYLVAQGHDLAHMHAHFAHTPTSVALYAAHLAGVDLSFTAHAKDIYTQDPRRVREKLARSKFAITCTKYNAEYLEQLAPPDKPVHCVYHGIDLSLFQNGQETRVPAPPYTILTIARLVEKKGLPDVFKALALLRDKGVDFRYVLVGSGKERKRVRSMLDKLGLMDRSELTGTITHEDVLELFRRSDAFVLGCRKARDGDRDGIPNVIAEAMAMGVPVAATDFSGIPELVEHGVTGLLSPSEDPAALAANLERLLTDHDLRRGIVHEAREKVRAVFDNRPLISEIGNIFQQAGIKAVNSGE